ncbi:hypothetical protein ACR79M_14845 [Sphingobacterium spiritivorum]
MSENYETIKIEIELSATRTIVNEELQDFLRDIRELAEVRGFTVKYD